MPDWFWSRPVGLILGLLAVVGATALMFVIDNTLVLIPNKSLPYTLLILLFAFGWGGRVGFGVGLASLLIVLNIILPRQGVGVREPSDLTRVVLIVFTYGSMVLVGDAFRRLRRANARLGGTVERLNAVIASIADGVLVVDQRGDLLQSNDGMRRILGGEVPRAFAERSRTWQTRHLDGSQLTVGVGPTTAALAGQITIGYEVTVRNARGERVPLSISSAPVRGPGGGIVGAVIVCRDITEVHRLQQAKDDFLSIASHELKTPLTSLRGYAQLLRQRIERQEIADERIGRYLGTIESQTRRVGALVDTLLDVSRLDAGRLQLRPAPFDLVALVREGAEQLGELSSRHRIVVVAESPLIEGNWDRDRIEQIVTNLLTNAIRYSPAGGEVTVTVGRQAAPAGAGGEETFVRVTDSGLGLEAAQLERIFERFHRAHEDEVVGYAEAQRGMGLGLFISRELAERHGGRLWAESNGPGRGATFVLALPPRVPALVLGTPAEERA